MSQRLAIVLSLATSLVLGACGDDGGDDNGNEEHDTGVAHGDSSVGGDAAADAATDAATDASADAGANDAAMDSSTIDAADSSTNDAAPDMDASANVDADVALDATTDAALDGSSEDDASSSDDADVTDAGPSPVHPTVAGQIVITEIQAAPGGYVDDSLAEWIEIFNPSTADTYDLGGCSFGDKAGDADYVIPENTLIAPLGYLTLSSNTFTVEANGFVSDIVYGPSGTGLSGTSDGPNIKCGQVVIDAVNYSAGAGFATPDSNEAHTLQLSSDKLSATDNDMGANWCFSTALFFTTPAPGSVANYGTPKAANAACP